MLRLIRKSLRRVRFWIEYVLACIGFWLVRVMPLNLLSVLFRSLAALMYVLLQGRRRIAIDNLLKCGVASSRPEADRIARASYRHFAVMFAEALESEKIITEDNWPDHVETDIPTETLDAIREPGKGIMIATAHFGNWEVAAQMMSFIKPVVAVARRMNNPYTDDMIQTRKTGHRFRMIPHHRANGAKLLQVLKHGEILAMLTDQHARKRNMKVNFLGRPAFAHTSLALLHFRSRAPLAAAYCVRTGPMQYRVVCSPLIMREPSGDTDADTRAILDAVNAHFEEGIRRYPEQYLWAHRRWRERP